jgi:hypothetical protein
MRTTLDLDEDVLLAAKELASRRNTTAGRVVSELVRAALRPTHRARIRHGVPLLPPLPAGAPAVTMKLVNRLRDE